MTQYTVVFEWEDDSAPIISRKDSWLGGKLISVQFNNALAQLDEVNERLEDLENLHYGD